MDLMALFFFFFNGSCDTNPRTPTQPKSQKIVPVTVHLPPYSPFWKPDTKLGDFMPTKL